jgi:hypothetical protein
VNYHLQWPHLAKLALKLRAITVQLNQGYPLQQLLADQDTLSLFKTLANFGDGVIESRQNATTLNQPLLEERFFSIADLLQQHHAPFSGHNQIAPQLMQSLYSSLKQQTCSACAPRSPCQWNKTSRITDNANLNSSGLCISPLKEMFDYAIEVSKIFYNSACPAEISWSTSHMHEGNKELNIAIAATTSDMKIRQDGVFERNIRISFYLDDFDIGDYLACLYAIFHEVFVHGWCGIAIDSATSTLSEDFHDGWMDWIAVDILQDFLENSWGTFQLINAYNNFFKRRTGDINSYRMDGFRQPRTPSIWKWLSGVQAAGTLRHIFGKAIGSNPYAHQLFLCFSMELNRSDVPDDIRSNLVNKINYLYSSSKNNSKILGQNLLRNPKVVDYILSFADTKNAQALVQSILTI